MEKEIIIIRDYNQDIFYHLSPSFGNLLMINAFSYFFLSLSILLPTILDNNIPKFN